MRSGFEEGSYLRRIDSVSLNSRLESHSNTETPKHERTRRILQRKAQASGVAPHSCAMKASDVGTAQNRSNTCDPEG